MKPVVVTSLLLMLALFSPRLRAEDVPLETCDGLPVVKVSVLETNFLFLVDTAATSMLNLKSFTHGDAKKIAVTSWSGTVETKADESGASRPASISYQAIAPLDKKVLVTGLKGDHDAEDLLAASLKGQAKIDAPWHSLGWRTWRFLQRTFHFKL